MEGYAYGGVIAYTCIELTYTPASCHSHSILSYLGLI